MALIDWRKEFETGIADVDHEHRELIRLINTLHDEIEADAEKAQVQAFLGEVFAKISAHFALEETIMRKHGYDEYLEHKAEHEELIDQLRNIMDESEIDYSKALSGVIRDWFVNHFKSKDARLHARLGV
ncbi:MAG: bacteriohemerythrin [Notoacmeibacter sp.]|nr:bacteriohemerythrin [Notoacmeibacter sp.]